MVSELLIMLQIVMERDIYSSASSLQYSGCYLICHEALMRFALYNWSLSIFVNENNIAVGRRGG